MTSKEVHDSDSDSGGVKLKKTLGLFNGVAIIVGVIVGSGIFVSPKGVLLEAGSVGLCMIIWALCGIICLIGAMCYAELGTCILKSGADYAYIMETFGGLPSFLYLWVALIIIFPTGNAITALTFSNYILQPFFSDCEMPDVSVRLLAALCITVLTFINCWSVKLASKVQDIFTVSKVLALIIIIITGLVFMGMGSTESFQEPFKGSTTKPGHFAMAFYSGLFSYAGWNYLNFVTEELKEPYKNLPRAIYISLPLVTVIYILANISYFVILSPAEMLKSDAVAVTFADRTLGVMSWIMPVFVALSTFGSLNGCLFTSSRLFFVGARYGHLPGFLATINPKLMTPVPALIFGCGMSLVMLCSSDIFALINYGAFVESLFIGVTIAGLIMLRYTRPDMERPIKVHIALPIFFVIICIFLIITPLTTSPMECLMGIIMICTGIPVYILGVLWTSKPKVFTKNLGRFDAISITNSIQPINTTSIAL
ncbi:hypothetical protein LOTGIDRAFT_109029 [Lottia gigantea]|uniref:Amino acid permease/ SLC12A domain-containing protein n=1 Tax=Lottia gigantea TaxID=225164 RepID=V3ZKE5_LOTGI|nr:hypothetical protein LOTGIDRAFT_109029 [Lottia gigantea]ESO82840.1 hypothetical protein LOTGIDRAFT_109029 [Lottia gigantea]